MDNGVYTLDATLYMMGHPKPLTVSGTDANIFGHSPTGPGISTIFSGGFWNSLRPVRGRDYLVLRT